MRGYTSFTEAATPEEVTQILGEFHAGLGGLIHKYDATLERFTGDGLMAFFNAPLPCPDPPDRAVRMAVDMQAVLRQLCSKWNDLGYRIGFGIGIAYGEATTGRIGFEGRFDYAAIGSVVNLASRLCSDAKDGQMNLSLHALLNANTVNPGNNYLSGSQFFVNLTATKNLAGFQIGPVAYYQKQVTGDANYGGPAVFRGQTFPGPEQYAVGGSVIHRFERASVQFMVTQDVFTWNAIQGTKAWFNVSYKLF